MRMRITRAGALLAAGVLLSACGTTGGTAVGPDVTVTQVVTTAGSPSEPDPVPSTTPSPSSTSAPESPTAPTEPTDETTEPSGTTESVETTESTELTDTPETSRAPTSTGKRPVASWLGDPPADPDTPGPEGGPACPANAEYVNESTEGLQTQVAKAWKNVVAKGKAADVVVCLNDGKRSRAQQQAQFDAYAKEYGEDVAKQLVLPPDRSAHVLGVAVDVQPAAAYQWLQATKGALGFCRIYDNEPWHFEYDPAFAQDGCPDRLPKPEA